MRHSGRILLPERLRAPTARPRAREGYNEYESGSTAARRGAPVADETTATRLGAGLEAALEALRAGRGSWPGVDPSRRRRLLEESRRSWSAVAPRWVEANLDIKGIAPRSPAAGEEWFTGPYLILRNLRLLAEALDEIDRLGRPRIPGGVRTLAGGQVAARVYPRDPEDRLFVPGVSAEVRMDPALRREELEGTMAVAYRSAAGPAHLALVLGAANISSIGPMDALYKLFVENRVVLYKMHPLNEDLAPLIEEGFASLVSLGVLRVVRGGSRVGSALCRHPEVDEIHITGSDRTVEAIVFGEGPEGERRKAEGRPLLHKPVSSELGNVSPVIVVPGDWSRGEVAYQARHLATMMAHNAGCNCNTARVLVQKKGWAGGEDLLGALEAVLGSLPPRRAYYPGSDERHRAFLEAHPGARTLGEPASGTLPWTLVRGLDPAAVDEPCFRREAFCSMTAETALEAGDLPDFLERAVDFCNERLWGTLNATLVVSRATLRRPGMAAALERALDRLRYGTVAVNQWAGVGYALVVPPWGAFPGHSLDDIQSGAGVVHNTLMFDRPQKSVIRAPFRARPTPPWFVTKRSGLEVARRLSAWEARRSPVRLPGIVAAALRA